MRRLFPAAVAAAVLATSVGAASAAPLYDTKLSINYSHSSKSFSGRVKSSLGACAVGRKVTVYRKQGGNDPSVGSDSASASGSWRVRPSRIVVGDYYAKAPTVRLRSNHGTCRAATSVTTHAS
jgi:hypothetical protein